MDTVHVQVMARVAVHVDILVQTVTALVVATVRQKLRRLASCTVLPVKGATSSVGLPSTPRHVPAPLRSLALVSARMGGGALSVTKRVLV